MGRYDGLAEGLGDLLRRFGQEIGEEVGQGNGEQLLGAIENLLGTGRSDALGLALDKLPKDLNAEDQAALQIWLSELEKNIASGNPTLPTPPEGLIEKFGPATLLSDIAAGLIEGGSPPDASTQPEEKRFSFADPMFMEQWAPKGHGNLFTLIEGVLATFWGGMTLENHQWKTGLNTNDYAQEQIERSMIGNPPSRDGARLEVPNEAYTAVTYHLPTGSRLEQASALLKNGFSMSAANKPIEEPQKELVANNTIAPVTNAPIVV